MPAVRSMSEAEKAARRDALRRKIAADDAYNAAINDLESKRRFVGDLGRNALGLPEAAASVIGGLFSQAGAGLGTAAGVVGDVVRGGIRVNIDDKGRVTAGIKQPDWDAAADIVNQHVAARTPLPQSEGGQAALEGVGTVMAPIDRGMDFVGERVSEGTGSPAAGALTYAGLNMLDPEHVLPVIGALRGARGFTQFARERAVPMQVDRATAGAFKLPDVFTDLTTKVDEAPAGKPAPSPKPKPKKKQAAVGNMWDEVNDPQQAQAMALRGAHLKRSPSGEYVGAPEGVASSSALQKLRRNADKQVEAGVEGMDWYDRARREAEGLAPDDPAMQSLFARGTAAYSPQSTPPTEIGSFIKQHNAQVLTGEPGRPRTQAQADAVARGYGPEGEFTPENIPLGKKTGPYADAKDPTIPEESLYKTANDIWHGRVMGYGADFDRGFTPQEHGFLTGENLLLADRAKKRDAAAGIERGAQWNPRSAQAATWTAQRKQQYLAEALKRGETDTPELRAAISERARAGIPEAVDANVAFINKEERPGSLTGEDPRAGDYGTSREMIPQRDPIIDALRMYQRDTVPTEGFYTNQQGVVERNPAGASPVLVGKNAGKAPSTPAADMAALEQAAHQHAFTRAQDSVGITRFFPESGQPVGSLNAVELKHGGLTTDQRAAMEQAAQDSGASPIDSGGRTLLVQFGDQGPVAGNTKSVIEALRARGATGQIKRGTVEANLVESKMPAEQGTGRATEHLLAESERREGLIPGLEQKTARATADDAAAVNELRQAAAKATGGKLRADLTRALEVLSKGGLPALREHVKKFGSAGLPAVVLAMLAGQAPQNEPAS